MTDKEKLDAVRTEVQNYIYAARKAHTNITEGNFAHLLSFIDSLQEEPVSEELEEAAFDYAEACKCDGGEKLLCVEHFKAGAKWKAEQFEKERLKHCDALTKEQAQIESDFVVDFIKKNNRTPTFIDAIEYGVKLKLKDGK